MAPVHQLAGANSRRREPREQNLSRGLVRRQTPKCDFTATGMCLPPIRACNMTSSRPGHSRSCAEAEDLESFVGAYRRDELDVTYTIAVRDSSRVASTPHSVFKVPLRGALKSRRSTSKV